MRAGSGEERIVRSDPVPEEQEETAVPPPVRYWDGEEYRLKSWQRMAAEIPEQQVEAEKVLVYPQVEQADQIPQEAEIEVKNEETGAAGTFLVPLAEARLENGTWTSDFSLPILAKEYDAGVFYIGEKTARLPEENPFVGYEQDLLELAGLDPEYYVIEHSAWTSQPWTGEDGLVYRQAAAAGQKYVADCRAVYRGTVTLPSVPGTVWEAVYEPVKAAASTPDTAEPAAKDGGQTADPDLEPQEAGNWYQKVRQVLLLGIGCLLLWILAVLLLRRILIRRIEKKKREGGR